MTNPTTQTGTEGENGPQRCGGKPGEPNARCPDCACRWQTAEELRSGEGCPERFVPCPGCPDCETTEDEPEVWTVDYENAESEPQHAVLSWLSDSQTSEANGLPEVGTQLVRHTDFLALKSRLDKAEAERDETERQNANIIRGTGAERRKAEELIEAAEHRAEEAEAKVGAYEKAIERLDLSDDFTVESAEPGELISCTRPVEDWIALRALTQQGEES